ncbi:hypothetical protein [uncultured Duncaniella sp.]|uniref:hypothetical protein n=1 Tax=uncultured Duncaniella sp. TaxID=2768039 RepID=UPI0025B1BE4E|nr:hypothetical protein [uncultured Duncaniella sp.]
MNFIYKTILILLPVSVMLASCSSDEPFSVAGPDDEPHILAPTFPDRNNGQLPVVSNISRDANFAMELTVTPADYVDVAWYIDGEQAATGRSIDMPLPAGTYEMKVVVTTTQGKSTSREGIISVNPLDSDPWASEVSFERIVAPGQMAALYGRNLSSVESITIGDSAHIPVVYSTEDGNDVLSYTVPENAGSGTFRLELIDADGMSYGANKVTVSSSALITSGADRITSGATTTFTGINLDRVASIEIGGSKISEFTEKTPTAISFSAPALEDGEYPMSGVMNDGAEVQFYKNSLIETVTTVVMSSQQTLWSGHHYVSWDLPDDSPNKTFNLIGMDVFAGITPGAVMSIRYSIEPTAEYHQLRTTTVWWNDLPGTGTVEFSSDGVVEITLTKEALDMIQEQAGFLCVGHGYYVDLVTLR